MKKLLYLLLIIVVACSSGGDNNRVKDTNICSEYINSKKYCRDSSKGYPYYTVEYSGFIVGEGVKDIDLEFVGLDKVYFNGKPYSGKSVNSNEQRTYKNGMLIHVKSFYGKEWFYDDNCLIKTIEYGINGNVVNINGRYIDEELDKVKYYKKLPLEQERKIDSIEYYYSRNKILYATERE